MLPSVIFKMPIKDFKGEPKSESKNEKFDFDSLDLARDYTQDKDFVPFAERKRKARQSIGFKPPPKRARREYPAWHSSEMPSDWSPEDNHLDPEFVAHNSLF